MDYNVIMTPNALDDLDRFIEYLLYEKYSVQAARSLSADVSSTIEVLAHSAGSFRYCTNPRLRAQGYRRIDLNTHRYYMLYRVDGRDVIIDNIFHELQDPDAWLR